MSDRILASTCAVAVVIALGLMAPASVAGQARSATAPANTGTLPRTPDGKSDLQGVWDYRTIAPLERPKERGTKAFFTDAEAAAFEKDENQRQNRDLIDPETGGLMYPPGRHPLQRILVRPRQ